jgi:hypothetical protein
VKHSLLASALVAVLFSYAAAQDLSAPRASLDPEPETASSLASVAHIPAPPTYCKPCLFYAGDFDSNASDANGLPNEKDIIVSTGAAVYTPFIVSKGKTWTVTGLITIQVMSTTDVDPKTMHYEVRKDIPRSGGNGGHLVCHGRQPGTINYTSICQGFGAECYAIKINNIKACRLSSGKYWMSVVPYCTNLSVCGGDWRAFLLNDDGAMAHRYGPLEPADNSFFNSKYFGANWDPSSKWQSSSRFSVGVEGKSN